MSEVICYTQCMSNTPLAKKFFIKPGQTIRLINAPDGYADLLGPLPDAATIVDQGDADSVHLFVTTKEALHRMVGDATQQVKPGGVLWVGYPKGSAKVPTDLHRDILWNEMKQYHLVGTTLIAVDATWSAMRFRPGESAD